MVHDLLSGVFKEETMFMSKSKGESLDNAHAYAQDTGEPDSGTTTEPGAAGDGEYDVCLPGDTSCGPTPTVSPSLATEEQMSAQGRALEMISIGAGDPEGGVVSLAARRARRFARYFDESTLQTRRKQR
jgi:hypothetical protein